MADKICIEELPGSPPTFYKLIAKFDMKDQLTNYHHKSYAYWFLLKNPNTSTNIEKMEDYVDVLRKLANQIETDLHNGVYND